MPAFGHKKTVRLIGPLSLTQSIAALAGLIVVVIIETVFGFGLTGLLVCFAIIGGIDYLLFIGRRGNMALGRFLFLRGAWLMRVPLRRWRPLTLPHRRTDRGIAPVYTPLGWSVARVTDSLGVVEHPDERVIVATLRSSALASALAADASHGRALVQLWGRFLDQLVQSTPVTAVSVTSLVSPLAPTEQAVTREAQRLIATTWPGGPPATLDQNALIRMVGSAVSTTTWLGLHVSRIQHVDFTALARTVRELGQLHTIDIRPLSAEQIVWELIARIASPYDWADQMGSRTVRVPSPQSIRPGYDALLIDDFVAARTGIVTGWPTNEVEERWWLRLIANLSQLRVATVATVHLLRVPPAAAQRELAKFGENAALQRNLEVSKGKTLTMEQDLQHLEVRQMLAEVMDGASLHWATGGLTMIAPRSMSSPEFSTRWRELRHIAATAGVTLSMPAGDALESWRAFAFPFGSVRRARD